MGFKRHKGETGNAAQYLTRNQALKKLQLKLPGFRRLSILKGIVPREPKKKVHGQNKTYYHTKDINFLLHEPLLLKFRQQAAYEKKIRKAKAKKNLDLAERLIKRKPTYRLDHLVKERYPSFVDALRELDDPLTLIHLFATLPAEQNHGIPERAVARARRLALEWQSYCVRTSSLRKVFISVKGFYYQADISGQQITWLVPHQLSQVLPDEVDWRVMLTFLEFYEALLQFVNFKLYHTLGLKYPPPVDAKLESAAEGLASIMQDMAKAAAAASARPAVKGVNPEAAARMQELPAKLPKLTKPTAAAAASAAEGDEDEGMGIDSGDESDAEEAEGAEPAEVVMEEAEQEAEAAAPAAAASAEDLVDETAGGAIGIDAGDDAAVCERLFKGLVFFLGREVPREQLMFMIRAFGGKVAWAGEGSPLEEGDESITHQVVDRPTVGHRYYSPKGPRVYVQPQWVFDSLNFRVLAPADLYVPGQAPPPHLSPFASSGDDEEYVPDYQKTLLALQDQANKVRARTMGEAQAGEGGFVGEAPTPVTEAAADKIQDAEALERAYAAELAQEMQGEDGEEAAAPAAPNAAAGDSAPASAHPAGMSEEEIMASAMMTRKNRKLYESLNRKKTTKLANVQKLALRKKILADGGI